MRLADAVDRDALIAECAAQTDGASGADLAYLCHAAARYCVQDAVQAGVQAEAVVITAAHLQQSLQIWVEEQAARRPARSASSPRATVRA